MKAKFFSSFPFEKREKEHLVSLLKMDEKLFTVIFNYANKQNSLKKITKSDIETITREHGFSPSSVIEARTNLNVILLLFSYAYKDSTQNIIEDLLELCSDSLKEVQSPKDRLVKIGELANKYKLMFDEKYTTENVVPMLKDFEGTVVIKPVFDDRFDFDEIDIKNYKPKLIKKVAAIQLNLKNSNEDDFIVQFDINQFEKFLNELISYQIELKTLTNEYN